MLIECSFGFQSMTFPPGEALCHAGSDARRGLVMTLVKGLVHVDDPLRDQEDYPCGTLLSPALSASAAGNVLIGEEAIWAAVFPQQPGIDLCSATVSAVTTATCMAMRADALLELLTHFPGYLRELKRPVLSRFTRNRIRLLVAGAHRVRLLLRKTQRLDKMHGVSFTAMIRAAQGTLGNASSSRKHVSQSLSPARTRLEALTPQLNGDTAHVNGGHGGVDRQSSLKATDLAIQRRQAGVLLLTTVKPALAVYIVSCAAPGTFRIMSAAARTIQRIYRGCMTRKRLRARLQHARLSKVAMQRLASRISAVDPAVACLESLRRVQLQLRSAMEQQEQVVAENVERAAVARERLRISAAGVPRMPSAPVRQEELTTSHE
jgi:CRP-like cAMP-binding protein